MYIYSRTSTNGHLSTTATFFCPGRQPIHYLLFKPLYNGHLSTMATSLQWPLFFVLADNPYVTSCLNLSTTATFFCPGRQPIDYLLFKPLYNGHVSTMAIFLSPRTAHTLPLVLSSLQRQWPLKRVLNWQNNLSTTANFSATDEKVKNGHEI